MAQLAPYNLQLTSLRREVLFFCNPASDARRELLTVRRSDDGVSAWPHPPKPRRLGLAQRQDRPLAARGAPALAHGGPLGSEQSLGPLGPYSAAVEPTRRRKKISAFDTPGGQTWPRSFVLEEGGAAYCSMGLLSSGALCVMCADLTSTSSHTPCCSPFAAHTRGSLYNSTSLDPPYYRYERADRISFATIAPLPQGPLGAF